MDTNPLRGALRRPLSRLAALLTIAILTHAFIVGCGGGGNETAGDQNTTTPPADTTPPAASVDTTAMATFTPEAAFKQKCAVCHGPAGMGDGPTAAALNPKPRNFHDAAYMSTRTDEQLFQVIHDGKGMMPAWSKAGLTDDQIRAMITYVRQFSKS